MPTQRQGLRTVRTRSRGRLFVPRDTRRVASPIASPTPLPPRHRPARTRTLRRRIPRLSADQQTYASEGIAASLNRGRTSSPCPSPPPLPVTRPMSRCRVGVSTHPTLFRSPALCDPARSASAIPDGVSPADRGRQSGPNHESSRRARSGNGGRSPTERSGLGASVTPPRLGTLLGRGALDASIGPMTANLVSPINT